MEDEKGREIVITEKVWQTGNSLVITLRQDILKYFNIKKGDIVKAKIKKYNKNKVKIERRL